MKTKWLMMAGLIALCGVAQAGFVTIGNAGNAADTTGYGAVGYNYKISATEVTVAEFQASGAGNGNENYWNDGIRTVGTNAPASRVSLYEAMKYCNYLTSGNINSGLYEYKALGVWGAKFDRATVMAGSVNYFALPTEDEWYKAAYYTGNSGDLWSLYANGTDTVPTHGTTAGWNYYNVGYVNGSPNYTWTAGYGGVEQNGTYDMMGNVWEWMEASGGVARGGNHYGSEGDLRSSKRYGIGLPGDGSGAVGFRVVAIPEPATALSLMLGGLLITGYRRIRKAYGL